MADESYIRQLQSQISARHSAQVEQTSKENREAAIVNEMAPKDWVKLKEWLRGAVTQVNQGNPLPHLIYEDGDNLNKAKIRYQMGQRQHQLEVTFLGMLGCPITVAGEKLNFEFDPEVRGRNVRWIESSNPLIEYTVDDMGKKILNSAVGV